MLSIADLRKDYQLQSLSKKDVASDPVDQFTRWWDEAVAAKIDEVNAMTLATASRDGMPSARIVLLKGFSVKGFNFFTNYDSVKGRHLAENPRACLVFFWKELERQVRISGLIDKLEDAESDAYFNSRPEASRISAYASPQSQVIESREWLEARQDILKQNAAAALVRPAHWGGYVVKPVAMEFWQGRPGRLHDRIRYTWVREGDWTIDRLAP